MLSLLQIYRSRVSTVFVAYTAHAGDAFYDTIRNQTVPALVGTGTQARSATSVIKPDATHDTHFHWVIVPQ